MPSSLNALLTGVQHFRGEGCEYCRYTGFHGRVPVYEMLIVDAPVARWIEEGGSRAQLANLLLESNHVSIWETGARLVRQELTTVDELRRILGSRD